MEVPTGESAPVVTPERTTSDSATLDTSNWQTYRNETAGFEVKIPKDWFCSGIALAPKSNENLICLEEKLKNEYYAGDFQNVKDYIMINFTDSENDALRDMRDRLAAKKEEGSKIVGLVISGQDSVLVDGSYLFDVMGKWNIVISSQVKKGVTDGFLMTFKFLK